MSPSATEQKGTNAAPMRIEKDSLGELQVPADAYYGVQTARAVANFPISGLRPSAAFVRATVQIKKAAAIVNARLGELPQDIADAIVAAADEVLSGQLADQFVVDVFQAGAGTSHNMNTNEVLANRAIELIAAKRGVEAKRGDYKVVNPNDHVNMAQSTNDVIPTAIRLAALQLCEKHSPRKRESLMELSNQAAHTCKMRCPSGWVRNLLPTRFPWVNTMRACTQPQKS